VKNTSPVPFRLPSAFEKESGTMGKIVFDEADLIEKSLELLAEQCGDPTGLVYDRLFESYPDMKALFWRDKDGAIKGEMLSQAFAAIIDFIGERQYADHLISTEIINHEGYDVPRDVFASFFYVIAEVMEITLGAEWTPQMAGAWHRMLAEIDTYTGRAPP
jgi:hemoglobin-like flavoprotein